MSANTAYKHCIDMMGLFSSTANM